ncbi:UNVERIFIED_CONTAM: hypothetical protein FKN15_039393 [Acipenser sinensis]
MEGLTLEPAVLSKNEIREKNSEASGVTSGRYRFNIQTKQRNRLRFYASFYAVTHDPLVNEYNLLSSLWLPHRLPSGSMRSCN